MRDIILFIAGIVVSAAAALTVWKLLPPPPVVTRNEPALPTVVQTDGSRVLERRPTSRQQKPVAALPPGGKLERQVEVLVQPVAPVTAQSEGTAPPPVKVDLSLVRMPDESRRVVASSPDGAVVGGVDIPVLPIERKLNWAAGISYGSSKTGGVWIERDLDRVRLGAELLRNPRGDAEVRFRLGWTF